jgi:pimeloyl-ACP methyl ester carboxylesterase
MSEEINPHRRRFFGTAAVTVAAAQLGLMGFANAQSAKPNSALPTIKPRTNKSFGALKQIDAGELNIGYAEAGPANGPAVILLHGWPYDIYSFVDVTPMLAAAGFDNSDHVAIVVHNYRWRLGVAAGEARYDDFEKKLAEAPVITVPTITLEGDANGAPHPEPAAYRSKFSVKYAHRTITGGIGHNLPQEAPQAFAQAVVQVDG